MRRYCVGPLLRDQHLPFLIPLTYSLSPRTFIHFRDWIFQYLFNALVHFCELIIIIEIRLFIILIRLAILTGNPVNECLSFQWYNRQFNAIEAVCRIIFHYGLSHFLVLLWFCLKCALVAWHIATIDCHVATSHWKSLFITSIFHQWTEFIRVHIFVIY